MTNERTNERTRAAVLEPQSVSRYKDHVGI